MLIEVLAICKSLIYNKTKSATLADEQPIKMISFSSLTNKIQPDYMQTVTFSVDLKHVKEDLIFNFSKRERCLVCQ